MRKIKVPTKDAHKPIAQGQDFTTHGALSGGWETTSWMPDGGWMGRSAFEEMKALVQAARDRGERRVYVVRSYETPIALLFEDGSTWESGVKHSVTTSRHQSYVREGVAGYRERVTGS